jgi:hypothetical protein
MEIVDLQFMTHGVTSPEHDTAICAAMLSAPAVKKVIVPPDLNEECLRILRDRKDWTIEKLKEPAE